MGEVDDSGSGGVKKILGEVNSPLGGLDISMVLASGKKEGYCTPSRICFIKELQETHRQNIKMCVSLPRIF